MLTTISSISRLSGVLSTKSTTKLNVTMLTTGKILEENRTFSTTMLTSFAKIGKQVLSLESMKRVASFNQLA